MDEGQTTMEQALIDQAESRRRAQEGIERSDRGVDAAWRMEADAVIVRLAASGVEFTTDDVWASGLTRVRENRALGARMQAAAKRGEIVRCGFAMTKQVTRHRSPVTVWKGTG